MLGGPRFFGGRMAYKGKVKGGKKVRDQKQDKGTKKGSKNTKKGSKGY